ncbi:MAG TPA: tRNA preQ1(34) S-adenosylmethionine ribosyltransferase-isomerase QueA [Clostridiales bacterium]|nr:tRNA preQ1(34) S-adenosylmethionine ribosyltransferase-isomerase QueA [Clostridiales bacterium]
MKTSDFSYELPQELIAQTPLAKRDASRLLHVPLDGGAFSHTTFEQLPGFLKPGDCLVFNDSRVMPARLLGVRASGGAAEVLLLRQMEGDLWQALVRPGRKLRNGATISFGDGLLACTVEGNGPDGSRFVRFSYEGIWHELLDRLGEMPLPPYITERLADPDRYQTVYAKEEGSAAAPTAGLHFTEELIKTIQQSVRLAFVTLHVGLGTFRPVKAEDIADHVMHKEVYSVPEEAANAINQTKAEGGRVIAVGTTSCRVLETASDENGKLSPGGGETGIFIYPGYRFKCLDGLITNFHLPESTLLMLVSALAGRERILAAYKEAVSKRYRFFSFGDAMLIL